MASLRDLARHGQSVWLDFIDRKLVRSGGLQRLVDSGVMGVTSHPTIFHRAITGSHDYDDAIRALVERDQGIDEARLCEALMVADVTAAADVLRPVYDRTLAKDGYVSIEVAPDLAYDVEGTISAARRLWRAVARPNVMIKVPGTAEGVCAFERLLTEEINVNVTLLFSVRRYEEVARAWARGLARSNRPQDVASVASFFVSRVDVKVDEKLDAIGTGEAAHLRGRIALANTKNAYQRFHALMKQEPELADELRRGARPQRLLWASTSTKDPRYSEVLYVQSLIGPDTVDTLTPETLDAFLYHGRASYSLEAEMSAVYRDLERLEAIGVDLEAVARELEAEGVASFNDSWRRLLAALREKRAAVTQDLARQ